MIIKWSKVIFYLVLGITGYLIICQPEKAIKVYEATIKKAMTEILVRVPDSVVKEIEKREPMPYPDYYTERAKKDKIVEEIYNNPNFKWETKETESRTYAKIYNEQGKVVADFTSRNKLAISGKTGSRDFSGEEKLWWFDKNGNRTYTIGPFGWFKDIYDGNNREIKSISYEDDIKGIIQMDLQEYWGNSKITKTYYGLSFGGNYGGKEIFKYRMRKIEYSESGKCLKETGYLCIIKFSLINEELLQPEKMMVQYIMEYVRDKYENNGEIVEKNVYEGNKEKLVWKEVIHYDSNGKFLEKHYFDAKTGKEIAYEEQKKRYLELISKYLTKKR